MPILDVIAGVLSRPAGRVVEAPVRDIVDEVLRQQDLTGPEELRSLRAEVARLNGELTSMQDRLGSLLGTLEGLQAETASLREALAAARADEPEPQPEPEPEPEAPKKRGRKSLAHLGCSVAGCEHDHRSKGFCARHYQAWRRGNLEGHVSPEGLAGDDTGAWQVDAKHAGKAFTLDTSGTRTKVVVEGKGVRSKKIA